MSKRTYAGPIIERFIEVGIVFADNDLYLDPFCCLAVDSGSGELVLVLDAFRTCYVSFYQPAGYVPMGIRSNTDVTFSVTDDLSETEGKS